MLFPVFRHAKLKRQHGRRRLPVALIFLQAPSLFLFSPQANATTPLQELYFNPRFLGDDPAAVADLSSFEKGQEVPPGTYRVDVYLNDSFMITQDITFRASRDGQGLVPCITSKQLISMGVSLSSLPIDGTSHNTCRLFTDLIKDGTTNFEVSHQRLKLTVPQAMMSNRSRGYIPPELWDDGINAGLLNYSFSGNTAKDSAGNSTDYAYLNLEAGLNAGPWRLRDNRAWSYNSGSNAGENKNEWQHVNSWLERDIRILRSRLIVGDNYTTGDIFDGVNFRGTQLSSDDNMLPDSQKGFAPAIHGIARSTSQVSIKQNGYEIYQSTVPPGPFTISDLYAAGNGGDLQVTIKETNGSTQVFSVPWATVPVLQREGHTRYALTAGNYRSGNTQQNDPGFFQSTLMQGLPAGWTAFGGTLLANRYRAINFGVGKNMGNFGAISADITQASATLPDDTDHQGQSIRFLYAKSLIETGTNFELMGYRYSTKGYYSFADTTYKQMSGYHQPTQDGKSEEKPSSANYYNLMHNRRGKLQINVSQQLGKTATLYINGSHQTYWGNSSADEQLQVGFNTAFDDINCSVSYSLIRNAWQEGHDQVLAFNVNVPFSHWMPSNSTSVWRHASASYNQSNDLKGRTTNLAGLYGTLLEDNNLSYSVQTGYSGGGDSNKSATGYAAMSYRGVYGNANVGYSHSDSFKQVYYGFSGGALAHANGITLSQPLNDTVVLVKAPGAGDTKVQNHIGVRTDWRGYAVLPYATEYRENRIALDADSLADNVDLDDTVASVVPTHGAVVRAAFDAHVGIKILMTLTHDGKPVPFGALASMQDDHNESNGSIVADNGQVYLNGMPLKGSILAKWGNSQDKSCIADYTLPPESQKLALSQVSAVCR